MTKSISLVIFWVAILGAGCGSNQVLPTAPATQQVYPGPVRVTPFSGAIPFRINRHVRVGDRTVKGTGPAGIPIVIVNVTLMGTILGGGPIGLDNHFEVTVLPLEANIRIGLDVGDLTGSGRVWEEFQADEYKGEGALLVPLVGYFQDTVVVQP